jgi:hypothetical protein
VDKWKLPSPSVHGFLKAAPVETRYSSGASLPRHALLEFGAGVESEQRQPLKVNIVKKWPWHKILVCVGWLLVVAGITPGAYILVRLGSAHNQKPLSVPVALNQGEFASPYFTAGSSDNYEISLNWDLLPARQTSVKLDWKIEADNGSVIVQGEFDKQLRGANSIKLGEYKPNSGQRERIVLIVHADVNQGGAHATLDIAPPDTSWKFSEAIPTVAGWAIFVAVPGVFLLLILAMVGARRRKGFDPGL